MIFNFLNLWIIEIYFERTAVSQHTFCTLVCEIVRRIVIYNYNKLYSSRFWVVRHMVANIVYIVFPCQIKLVRMADNIYLIFNLL